MSQELLAALLMCLLAPLHAIVAATANAMIAGFKWGLGNRHTRPDLPHWAVRLSRAHANLLENLPSFVGIVLIGQVAAVHDQVTVSAAWLFLASRVLFVFVYAFGITFLYLRTVLFFTSVIAMGAIAWRVFASVST
jgi:uncharacterized MAPEG superfamily protein